MTRTIEVDARAEQGHIVLDIPADIPDGPVHLVVTIETPAPRLTADEFFAQLQMIEPAGWPPDARFGRDELYDDDGR